MIWRLFSIFCLLFHHAQGNLLIKGITTETLELNINQYQLIGIPQASLNQTELEITFDCAHDIDLEFTAQFAIRSSPCNKEFFNTKNSERLKELLQFYFDQEDKIPAEYDYKQIVYYKSMEKIFTCKDAHGRMVFTDEGLPAQPQPHQVVNGKRTKRDIYSGLNGDTVDGGTSRSLSTWHPAVRLPIDAIYFAIVKFQLTQNSKVKTGNVTVITKWRGPYGFLSAIDYPLLGFYAFMCLFYGILSMVWLILCIRHFKDILKIQYWIGGVIILGMVEKAMFYSEYSTMNNYGENVDGVIEAAELISCLKRTMSRVLIIIVSVGYGIVKPRLGQTLSQVAGVGFVYFIFCAIEGLARVSKNHAEAVKQKQFAALPLVIVEMTIFYWIFTSLTGTMRTLKMRRNEIKLSVYRHFTNTLCFAVLASVIYMCWSLAFHIFPNCLTDWKELWVDTAFWHVLFCSILVVIVILWRPSQNNQQYAFTPLLDDSEDENEDDVLIGNNLLLDGVKIRSTDEVKERKEQREQRERDSKLEEELKWIENNIPTTLAESLLIDDEDDKEARDLERSKML
ncbi:unnamed protein product, partial [Mesorhabditis belari]|uniref:Transmembrane protein 87A n=1 Tax=Mesorhabditis belari TaxID=2138241 RepID=A0AAF3EGV9_9BILA